MAARGIDRVRVPITRMTELSMSTAASTVTLKPDGSSIPIKPGTSGAMGAAQRWRLADPDFGEGWLRQLANPSKLTRHRLQPPDP